MKKYYEAPELELFALLTGDIVTLSVGISSEDGDINGNYKSNEEPTEAWRYN